MNWLKQNWVIVIITPLVLGNLFLFQKSRSSSFDSALIGETSLPVGSSVSVIETKDSICLNHLEYPSSLKFDSKTVKHEDNGYYLDIPSLNESVCVWRYKAGTKVFTYLEITKAEDSERHVFNLDAFACTDLNVLCFSDDCKNYRGVFVREDTDR